MASSAENDAAATAVIRSLGPQVLRYLRSLLRHEDAAAEAFSQWAENVWKGLSAFRGEGTVRGWCFRLAYNAALNLQNEAWRRRGERLATSAASQLADDLRTRTAVRVERQRQALDVLRESLSVEERSLLTLRIDQELPWADIAQALAAEGHPADPAALMKRFERLKERLARMAKEQGLLD
jgi:RNA polymerase sigma-70 factor (ECF subfamily)